MLTVEYRSSGGVPSGQARRLAMWHCEFRVVLCGVLAALVMRGAAVTAAEGPGLGVGAEKHVMIPMRDGKRLSAYLYFPSGEGPWPVLYEQRYADLRAAGTRKAFARLAEAGYVVAAENFRGTHLSEGTWVGYRALGWGELQ